jgi:hypothetical protein
MPTFATRLTMFRDQIAVLVGARLVGPLLIDRGEGLLYDIERNITWLQDANYAATVRRSPDGQLRWNDAMTWVAGLRYRGISGWRLPDARDVDRSGPQVGNDYAGGEIGHLFIVAAKRMSPPDLTLTNFYPFSIYWYRNEASATEAYAFKMFGLKQGPLDKDPWGGFGVPTDKILAWPVHDGDVAGSLLSRLVSVVRMRLLTRRSAVAGSR